MQCAYNNLSTSNVRTAAYLLIAKFLGIKFFVDNSAKSSMLCFVDMTKSTLTDNLQVGQFTVRHRLYLFLETQCNIKYSALA